ncbi:co-regulatory protein PtrA N-terminal domain-containing protein [Stutzerimonas nitrititolerans]|uniref:co-regulatory protein PtrA N-terminal domain-containing protein n=1 Tax=Stutzerimonas nitrititolerans TaxID=2482751 RepID=UPI00289B4378|nr:co-regulatory protein PtrA N-terminal domain-containing protein [Stutzerimonas nitrititolerans]
MSRPAKVILPFFFAFASSLAVAEGEGELTMQRVDSASVKKPTLKMLVKEGKVLSIAPAGMTGTTGMIQNYGANGKVQTYEMKIKSPDGNIHTVEFLSAPVGVNNG